MLFLLPAPASSQVAKTYEIQPSATTGIASGTAVDMIDHGIDSTGVWMATGKGLNFSFDSGEHWFVTNTTNGLPSDNLSAVFSAGDRIWIASNHNEFIEGELRILSDGLTYSDDNGQTWTRINFGSSGLNIPFVWGGDRSIYDITGHYDEGFLDYRATGGDVDWLFFTAFAGGFLASQDGGISWRRVYPSPADSIQFNLTDEAPSVRNRYFSCVADTSHGDSLFVWTGTAGGIFQYIYAPPSAKLSSRTFYGVEFCDSCSADSVGVVFYAGRNGLSVGRTTGGPYSTAFTTSGLPGQQVTAVVSLGENLLVGTIDTATTASTGLAVSTDQGASFTPVNLPEVVGLGRNINAFARMDDRLYMAASEAGLFVSIDSGLAWDHISLDTVVAGSDFQFVYYASVLEDSLLLGTDSGLVALALDGTGNIVDYRHTTFPEDDTSSARVVKVKPQIFLNPDSVYFVDSVALWTINLPATVSGTSFVGRRHASGSWSHYQIGVVNYDINFQGDTAFAMGESGVGFTARATDPVSRYTIRQTVGDTLVVETFASDTVTSMAIKGDTVIFTSFDGLAISDDGGRTYTINRPNIDTLGADLVINHTYLGSGGGVPGDFVPALAVQYRGSDPARIWASGRPVDGLGFGGIGYGEYQTITDDLGDSIGFDLVWNAVFEDDYAWNFEFVGDSIFAATNDGLLFSEGTLDSLNTVWDTIDLIDEVTGEVLVDPLTAVFGVGAVDSLLWVGSNDGIVSLRLDDFGQKRLYLRVDSAAAADEVYAFPVPFRPGLEQEVDFHFVVEQDGNVTLEIYDFAMNLVARPIDNVFYRAGIYPDGSSQGVTWDGRNGKGDLAAVGVYYFKVEFDSGETRWGKLAVMP